MVERLNELILLTVDSTSPLDDERSQSPWSAIVVELEYFIRHFPGCRWPFRNSTRLTMEVNDSTLVNQFNY